LNDRNFLQRSWDPAIVAVGSARFTPHALRHLWASHLLQGGAPVAYVSEQLGHESPAFTYKQYVRFIPRSKEEAQGYLQAAFGTPTQ
jgi:integrase